MTYLYNVNNQPVRKKTLVLCCSITQVSLCDNLIIWYSGTMTTNVILDQSSSQTIHDIVPGTLTELPFKDINIECSTDGSFIQGTVHIKCPFHRLKSASRMKIILQQEKSDFKLPVFLMGKCAEDCQLICEGDLLALSQVTVEPNSRQQQQELEYQLSVDPTKGDPLIWVVRRGISNDDAHSGTSAAKTIPQSKLATARGYNYTSLNNIKCGEVVNVYGVVKFLVPASRTRGTDYMLRASIVDNTGSDKLKCNFFQRNEWDLPRIQKLGDIVRFHRLKIQTYKDELQGVSSRGFSSLVFDGEVGGSMTPRVTSNTYTLTQQDMDKVCELRAWTAEADDVLSQAVTLTPSANLGICQLEECQIGQFFDLVCQVVGTCVLFPGERGETVLLQIWDGTRPNFRVKEEDLSKSDAIDRLVVDNNLLTKAGDLVVEVSIFDNHMVNAKVIEPGEYIKITNLHAVRYNTQDAGPSRYTVPPVELDLHGGGATYGRDVEILDPNQPEVVALKTRLGLDDSQNMESGTDYNLHEGYYQNSDNQTVQEVMSSDIPAPAHSCESDKQCMLTTATVITGHHEQPICTLQQVTSHSVPFKFHVRCHVTDYTPHPNDPCDLIRLHCTRCNYISGVPQANNNNSESDTSVVPVYVKTAHKIKYYHCPVCPTEGHTDNDFLEYTMMIQFLLEDSTAWLVAGLWGANAEQFFHGTYAEDLLLEPKAFKFVQSRLAKLCPGKHAPEPQNGQRTSLLGTSGQGTILPSTSGQGTSLPSTSGQGTILPSTSRQGTSFPNISGQGTRPVESAEATTKDCNPLIECCIKSYHSGGSGTCYQIFDTCVEWSDADTSIPL